MLYLMDGDVKTVFPTTSELLKIVEDSLESLAENKIVMTPRATLESGSGARFISFPAILEPQHVAGAKWLGLHPAPPPTLQNNGGSIILLSSTIDARPFAIIDGRYITAMRTAAVSAVAATRLASTASSTVAFIACGEQARLHLEMLNQTYDLTLVKAYSRRTETSEQFAVHARTLGLKALVCEDVNACVANADIVISSAPTATSELVDYQQLRNGAFVSLVDLGRSLDMGSLDPTTVVTVDNVPQATALVEAGAIALRAGVRLLELTEASNGANLYGRSNLFLPTGLGAIDLQIALNIHEAALEKGIGLRLAE